MTKTLIARTCERCDARFVAKTENQRFCSLKCRKAKRKPEPEPQPEYTLTDASNHLLSLGPSALSCGIIKTDEGPRLIMTIRTTSATVTIALTDKEAGKWLTKFSQNVSAIEEVTASQE